MGEIEAVFNLGQNSHDISSRHEIDSCMQNFTFSLKPKLAFVNTSTIGMFDFIGIAASVDYANMPGRSLPSCNWVSFQTADSLIKVLHGMLRTYLTIGLVIRDDLEV